MEDFITLQKIGSGSFSSVYKVIRKEDKQCYALKSIRLSHLSSKEQSNALNEIRLLASIHSQHIIGYKQAFFLEEHETVCLVLEYADGGDLQVYMKQNFLGKTGNSVQKRIPDNFFWKLAIHLLKGLRTLHSHQIVHRDIKAANIFIAKGLFKLGDLNVASIAKGGLLQTQTGTPYYASPEVWRHELYNEKSDIWSLGCLLYEVVSGKPPFEGKSMNELYENIQKGSYKRLTISESMNRIISICLKLFPEKRLSASRILELELVKTECKYFGIQIENENNEDFDMLNTIVMPSNLKNLKHKLPSPNYSKPPMKRKISTNSLNDKKLSNQSSSTFCKKKLDLNSDNLIQSNISQTKNTLNRPKSTISHSSLLKKKDKIILKSNLSNVLPKATTINSPNSSKNISRIQSASPITKSLKSISPILSSALKNLRLPKYNPSNVPPISSRPISGPTMIRSPISEEIKNKFLNGKNSIFTIERKSISTFKSQNKRPQSEYTRPIELSLFKSRVKKLEPLRLSRDKIDGLIKRISESSQATRNSKICL